MNHPHSTAPKPYQCALASVVPCSTVVYHVVDKSDGDAVVGEFRNRVLADRQAQLSPAYEVREYIIRR